MKSLKLSVALAATLLVGSAKSGNTFQNIVNHGGIGAACASLSFLGTYKLSKDADIATTVASTCALAAMQAKEEKIIGAKYDGAKTCRILKEAAKPWVGFFTAKGLPHFAKVLKYLRAPEYLVPEVKMSANVANLVLLAGITAFKMMGHLQEV